MKKILSLSLILIALLTFVTGCAPGGPAETTSTEGAVLYEQLDLSMTGVKVDPNGEEDPSKTIAFTLTGVVAKNKKQQEDAAEIQLIFLDRPELKYPELFYQYNPAFPDVYFCGGAMYYAVPNQMGRLDIYLDRDLEYCILVTEHEIYCAPNTAAIDQQELLRIIETYTK